MFVTKYTGRLPEDLERHFRENSRKQYNNERYREVRVIKKRYSKIIDNIYFSGAVYFRKKIEDFDYKIRNLEEVEKTPKETFIAYELDFIIMENPKVIVFFSKEDAYLFGSSILSDILFGSNDKLKPIIFDCTAIFRNKRREGITDITHNGVRTSGKITAQGQWGSDIDNDAEFLDLDDRYAIGFLWDQLKITVFRRGSIIFKANMVKDIDEQMKLRRKVLEKFLKYSNYSTI